jgi:hypothetical protein
VWQPIPLYRYDLSQHPFADLDFGKNNYARFGYPLLADRLRQSPQGPDFLWAADIQNSLEEPTTRTRGRPPPRFSRRP